MGVAARKGLGITDLNTVFNNDMLAERFYHEKNACFKYNFHRFLRSDTIAVIYYRAYLNAV